MPAKRKKNSDGIELVYDPADGQRRMCVPLQREVKPGDRVTCPADQADGWRQTGFYRDPTADDTKGGES